MKDYLARSIYLFIYFQLNELPGSVNFPVIQNGKCVC